MTDTLKLQALFEAALRDSSDFTGRMPKPAGPPAKPAIDRAAATVPVRAGFKPMMTTAEPARVSTVIR